MRFCVFAGSRCGNDPLYAEMATELGAALGRRGIGVVFGGGGGGLMGRMADAALAAGGEVIGIFPEFLGAMETPHESLSELHYVDGMHRRKAMMEDMSDGFITLPGGIGTFEEFFEMFTWRQLGRHAKPVGLLDVGDYYAPLTAMLDRAVERGFMGAATRDDLFVSSRVDVLLDAMGKAVGRADEAGLRTVGR